MKNTIKIQCNSYPIYITSIVIWVLLIGFLPHNILAQSPRCYSQEFKEQYQGSGILTYHNDNQNPNISLREGMTIPIVFHIVYNTEFENISIDQIYSQIDVMNWAFNHDNKERIPDIFKSIVGNPKIKFCLASEDQFGFKTSGITRTKTAKRQIGFPKKQDVKFDNRGGSNAWNTKQYLNIWVANVGENILGYSSFPDVAGSNIDGIVIDPRYFGTIPSKILTSPYTLGRTLVHEIGHYLGLCHLGGCQTVSCDVDDSIDDTPLQSVSYANFDCPTHPQISCQSEDMFMNYMSLASDPCLWSFTNGQIDKMIFELNDKRSALINSSLCHFEPTINWSELIIVKNIPQSNLLLIEAKSPIYQDISFAMYDLTGRIIHQSSFKEKYLVKIDQSFSQGIYILYFYDSKNRFSKEIFIY